MSSRSNQPEDQSSPETPGEDPEASPTCHKKAIVKGVAYGIGSAAIVAALLFAGRNRGKTED